MQAELEGGDGKGRDTKQARGPSRVLRSTFGATLTFLICFTIYLRFHGLDEKGLSGSDTVYYTSIAQAWSEGDRIYKVGTAWPTYRPTVFFAFASSFKLFGLSDSAIARMNASLDAATILLVFVVAYFLAPRNIWVAFSAALVYGCLPAAIYMSRIELAHTVSVFLVTASFALLVWHLAARSRYGGYLSLAACGACVGLAALSHQELLFLAPGFLLSTFAAAARRAKYRLVAPEAVSFMARMAAFLAPMLLVCHRLFAFSKQQASRVANVDEGLGERLMAFFVRWPRFAWNSLTGNASSLFCALFVLIVILLLIRPLRRRLSAMRMPIGLSVARYAPAMIIVVHLLLCAFFFRGYALRLFLPLLPLAIIFTILWWYGLLRAFGVRELGGALLVVVLASLVIVLNLGHYPGYQKRMGSGYSESKWDIAAPLADLDLRRAARMFSVHNFSRSWAKKIYSLLESDVNGDARVLVVSSLATPWPGRRLLQAGFYFGDDAVYVVDHDEPLGEVVRKQRIKYVLVTAYGREHSLLGRRVYDRYEYDGRYRQVPLLLGASYGFEPGEYSIEKELLFIKDYLRQSGARLLYSSPGKDADVLRLVKNSQHYMLYEL